MGEIIRIEGERYLLKEPNGDERAFHVDGRTRKDVVREGDRVQVYVTKEGYAEYVQRLEQ